jgi:hypothetical protein
MLGGN